MNKQFDQAYNNVMEMNNIAVSLVERRCFDEAMEVFSYALVLMRDVSRGPSEPSWHDFDSSIHDQALRNAHGRLCDCISQQVTKDPNMRTITQEELHGMVGSLSKHKSTSEEIMRKGRAFGDFLRPIRLELTADAIPHDLDHKCEMECAIMLYNVAVFRISMAGYAPCDHHGRATEVARSQLLHALELLHNSYELLITFVRESCTQVQRHDIDLELLPLTFMILQLSAAVAHWLGMHLDAKYYLNYSSQMASFILGGAAYNSSGGEFHRHAAGAA